MEGYPRDRTGLLLVDPYNDFLSEGGKLWPFAKEVAESVDLLAHLREIANTDLDFQLKQHGIVSVIVIGLLAKTCIESTSRFAMELGYHVTLVKDAIAAFSKEMMHAAHELNGPTFAHAIVTTAELVAALPAPRKEQR